MKWRRPEVEEGILESTCSWILQNEDFNHWFHHRRGLFWVQGKPGSEKSTLMAFIYQHLTNDKGKGLGGKKQDIKLEHFFMGRGDVTQRSRNGMLRSLLHQLLQDDEQVQRATLHKLGDKMPLGEFNKDWSWTDQELKKLLHENILDAATRRTVTIIVDALDESGAQAQTILQDFHNLHDKLAKAGTAANVRVCISCRHYPVFHTAPCLGVVVEDHNLADIKLYLDHHLNRRLSCHLEDTPAAELTRLKEEIARMASGLFLWVRLVVDIVDWSRNLPTIRAQVTNLPRGGLHSLFESILVERIEHDNRPKALQLLQWISLAARPLTVVELRYAMASDNKESASDPKWFETDTVFSETSNFRMATQVNVLSGGLATVRDSQSTEGDGGKVQFIHESVKQYLLEGKGLYKFLTLPGLKAELSILGDASAGNSESAMLIATGHHRLLSSCLNHYKWTCAHPLQTFNESQMLWRYGRGNASAHRPSLGYVIEFLFYHVEHVSQTSPKDLSDELRKPGCDFRKWSDLYRKMGKVQSRYWPSVGSALLHMSCRLNLKSTIELLITSKDGANIIERGDEFGNTALRPDTRNDKGMTTLEIASINGNEHIVDQLLEEGANIDQTVGDAGTILQAAALRGDVKMVKRFLDNGANVNVSSGRPGSALQAASSSGYIDVVELLLRPEYGADINLAGGEYGTALQTAAFRGHTAIIDKLLGKGADFNVSGGLLGSALQAACFGGRIAVVRKLLGAYAVRIDMEGGHYGSALQAAAARGHTAIVKILLQNEANINVNGGAKGSPLQLAISSQTDEVDFTISSQLDEVVALLLDRDADVNVRGGEHGTALQAACITLWGRPNGRETIQRLLDVGADVNERGGAADSALIRTIVDQEATEDDVERLLKRGADPSIQGDKGRTGLYHAALRGIPDIVELLLRYGANAGGCDDFNSTPLHAVAESGYGFPSAQDHVRIAQMLLDSGADVNAKDARGQAPLAIAAASALTELVRLLLDTPGIDIETTDKDGATPLMRTVWRT
ncbi:ankyrin repeat-containing domain protein, partial [Podospora aff. communis PSN243]